VTARERLRKATYNNHFIELVLGDHAKELAKAAEALTSDCTHSNPDECDFCRGVREACKVVSKGGQHD